MLSISSYRYRRLFLAPPNDPPYTQERERIVHEQFLMDDLTTHGSWVLSGSLCGWGDVAIPLFELVTFLWIPQDRRQPTGCPLSSDARPFRYMVNPQLASIPLLKLQKKCLHTARMNSISFACSHDFVPAILTPYDDGAVDTYASNQGATA